MHSRGSPPTRSYTHQRTGIGICTASKLIQTPEVAPQTLSEARITVTLSNLPHEALTSPLPLLSLEGLLSLEPGGEDAGFEEAEEC